VFKFIYFLFVCLCWGWFLGCWWICLVGLCWGWICKGAQKSELKITELSQQDWAPWAQVYPECDSVEKFEAFYSDYSKQSESQKAKVLIVFSGTTPVGTVSVFNISEGVFRSALIEYMIREDYRKMGYGPKAVTLLEKYCFEELGLLKLFAYIAPTNEPSLRLIRSLGTFQLQTTLTSVRYSIGLSGKRTARSLSLVCLTGRDIHVASD